MPPSASKPPADLLPIEEFLAEHPPFDELSEAERRGAARQVEIEYFRRGRPLVPFGKAPERVYLVRSGRLQEYDESARLRAEYGEGESCCAESIVGEAPYRRSLTAAEDSLVYGFAADRFRRLCEANRVVGAFFEGRAAGRLRVSVRPPGAVDGSGLTTRVGSLVSRPLVSVAASVSIEEAARLMTRERVSSLIVEGPVGLGIVTDRDLRSRVLAERRDPAQPIYQVMSEPVHSVRADCTVAEALLSMMQRGVHHLLVTEEEEPKGVLTGSDLLRAQEVHPVYLAEAVRRAGTLAELAGLAGERAQVVRAMVNAGARAVDVHRVLTKIADVFVARCVEGVWQQLESQGTARAESGWCWVAFGSQAREELALGSDQDNGLILESDDPELEATLKPFAEGVCRWLDACGYPLCPGDMMAKVDAWRKPLAFWEGRMLRWFREPSKDAVMHADIILDRRPIVGDASLSEKLAEFSAREAKKHPLFLAHLARDALVRRPPVGLFRQFTVEHGGEHADTLDIKHRGLIPIVDLARFYAYQSECTEANTRARLRHSAQRGVLSRQGCAELLDAFEVIGSHRLRHHVALLDQGQRPDNHLDPRDLTPRSRSELKDAFGVVKQIQDAVEHGHQLGLLSG